MIISKTGAVMKTITAAKLDSTQIMTVISMSETSLKENDIVRLPYSVDHWHIADGFVNIYYTNGLQLEIERINYGTVVSGLKKC